MFIFRSIATTGRTHYLPFFFTDFFAPLTGPLPYRGLFLSFWPQPHVTHILVPYLCRAVFFAIFFGCATNWSPLALPFALALLVAAFSPGVKESQAFFGRYRFLPLDGFPSEVVHSCSVHFLRDFCDFFKAISSCNPRQLFCTH